MYANISVFSFIIDWNKNRQLRELLIAETIRWSEDMFQSTESTLGELSAYYCLIIIYVYVEYMLWEDATG